MNIEKSDEAFIEPKDFLKHSWVFSSGVRGPLYILFLTVLGVFVLGSMSSVSSFVLNAFDVYLLAWVYMALDKWKRGDRFNLLQEFSSFCGNTTLLKKLFPLALASGLAEVLRFLIMKVTMGGVSGFVPVLIITAIELYFLFFVVFFILFEEMNFADGVKENIRVVQENLSYLIMIALWCSLYVFILALPMGLGIVVFFPALIVAPYVLYKLIRVKPIERIKEN